MGKELKIIQFYTELGDSGYLNQVRNLDWFANKKHPDSDWSCVIEKISVAFHNWEEDSPVEDSPVQLLE